MLLGPAAIQARAKDKILRNFWGFLLLSLGLISPGSAETFRNPRHIAIPSNPLQVGTADFNGDGRPDFYYADASGLNVILRKLQRQLRRAEDNSYRDCHAADGSSCTSQRQLPGSRLQRRWLRGRSLSYA